MNTTCFFMGTRFTPPTVYTRLEAAVERHITEFGVTEFVVGHYGNFDRMAARAVIEAKKRHPEVKLAMLLPYHPFDQPIETPEGFDYTFYPPGQEKVPKRVAIKRANYYMLDHIGFLIAYADRPGNALEYMSDALMKVGKGIVIRIEDLTSPRRKGRII